MVSFTAIAALLGASLMQGALAIPQGGPIIVTTTSAPVTLPGHRVCTSYPLPTATTTVHPFDCLRFACLDPTSTCKPSELPKPTPASTTITSDCKVTVSIDERCGCATCVAPTGATIF